LSGTTDRGWLQPPTCFACGTENPHGLHLLFDRSHDDSAIAQFTPHTYHEGWAGIVHGGIVVTILDEAMAYALYFSGIRAVTARMENRFRLPMLSGHEVTIRAWIVNRRAKLVDAAAVISVPDSQIVAEATGRYLISDVHV
jgi:acyl-coenzyme A thioesterase PaaI-like protein